MTIAIRWHIFAVAAVLCASLFSSFLAAAADTSPIDGDKADIENDPFEVTNRAMFDIDQWLDSAILRPVAIGYRAAVPGIAQDGVRNVLNNLNSPIVFANNIFQGEFESASDTLLRFALNSTVGLGGLLDVANEFDIAHRDEDFGQTMAVWGVDDGPYLYLLFMGPSSARDLTGFIVDRAFDPLTYISGSESGVYAAAGLTIVGIVDLRARNIETLDDIERSSVDYYASIRSLYRQSRADSIRNGAPSGTLPEFDPDPATQ